MAETLVKLNTVDATRMTIQEALRMMLAQKMGQLHAPIGEHTHLHIALVHDAQESAALSVVIDKAVNASIAKHNARFQARHGNGNGSAH